MTIVAPAHLPTQSIGFFARTLALIYGSVAYGLAVGNFVYAIGFTSRFIVPKTINSGAAVPPLSAVVTDLALLALFAIQHSGVAYKWCKGALAHIVPPVIERSTHVLCTNLVLVAVFSLWQPVRHVIWHIDDLAIAFSLQCMSMCGWLIVLYGSFLIGHFELLGLKQVVFYFIGRALPACDNSSGFNDVRDAIRLGFFIAVWATPTMTAGNLLFALVATAYMVIGIVLEQHGLLAACRKRSVSAL